MSEKSACDVQVRRVGKGMVGLYKHYCKKCGKRVGSTASDGTNTSFHWFCAFCGWREERMDYGVSDAQRMAVTLSERRKRGDKWWLVERKNA